ncbi:S41 family peptidase [Virgibacillus sp. SK37]|uniref:S41 family peptidase n=1 Tax=Virgibacillus sp. SK37 TaxID=403957 RepID=UPI0004D1660A|nr:S41 family peptidase [Virgibacillus sp. SK37]AIF43079.1 peptidase [Virgibacillus sp. SK37]
MYISIFNEIVRIMHEDYAGCLDKRGQHRPKIFRQRIVDLEKSGKNDQIFIDIVKDYLLDFQDRHIHLGIAGNAASKVTTGFQVRRFRESLVVTRCDQENRLIPGDEIIALDDVDVLELVQRHKRQLMETEAEREDWESILPLYTTARVKKASREIHSLTLQKAPKQPIPPIYSFNKISNDLALMVLTDFMDENAISELIRENEKILGSVENLVIDVRINNGGSDLAFLKLLPYLFEGETINLSDFDDGQMLTNCTELNVDLRVELLEIAVGRVKDEETIKQIKELITELKRNRGAGFVELNFGTKEESFVLPTKKGPEKIIILSDVYCGSSGDSFVEICKHSSKVTVVGRPTLGLNDYANLAIKKLESKFELWYPTSKLSKVEGGKGMTGVGIQPDIYVPWSPAHLQEDLDMKRALEIIYATN